MKFSEIFPLLSRQIKNSEIDQSAKDIFIEETVLLRMEELQVLKALFDEGLVDKKEYETMKSQIDKMSKKKPKKYNSDKKLKKIEPETLFSREDQGVQKSPHTQNTRKRNSSSMDSIRRYKARSISKLSLQTGESEEGKT
jgi:hypothetical protein